MKLTIRLYATTRSDPVPDLDDIKSSAELAKWKQDVRKHALKLKDYEIISEDIIDDLLEYTIKECYALVAYSPGASFDESHRKMGEANEVGQQLLKFLRKHSQKLTWKLEETGMSAVSVAEIADKQRMLDPGRYWDNFTYSIIADKRLANDEYEIDLEAVVED
jgi:hypothetical protein